MCAKRADIVIFMLKWLNWNNLSTFEIIFRGGELGCKKIFGPMPTNPFVVPPLMGTERLFQIPLETEKQTNKQNKKQKQKTL